LDPSEFADSPESYASFNGFFYRKLKPSSRPMDPDETSVVFPADGRHLGFQRASAIGGVFVKGQKFDLPGLLGDADLAAKYADGALVLSRLCPVDYHRFHFPAAGVPGETRLINGPLFSVSPIALRKHLSYLWQNKRTITLLETRGFGTVILMEIGATCVGSIRQTFHPGQVVEKGAEKGYFAFGGSSTITIFEPGAVRLETDLADFSSRQTELYARYDIVVPDDTRTNGDKFNTFTAGVNYFIAPKSQAARLSFDLIWFLNDQATSAGLIGTSTAQPLLASPEDNQFALRAQLQIMF
jgi:phosphatidylserine decarboxylase